MLFFNKKKGVILHSCDLETFLTKIRDYIKDPPVVQDMQPIMRHQISESRNT